MKNKRGKTVLTVVTVAAVLFALSATANAAVVVEEQFIYEPLQANIDGQNGGTGFDGPWVSTISHGRIYWLVEGLSFSTLPVAGNALSRYGSMGRAEAHRLISVDSQAALTSDNTTIWFSQLFAGTSANRNAMFIFGTQPFSHTPGYQLAAPGDGFGFTIANINPDGTGGNGDGSINAVAFDDSNTATFVKGTYTPSPLTATCLIVGKINWKPNGTPDELFLFNVTDLSTEPPESAAFASIAIDFDQSAFNLIAMYDGTNSITDEIRFGNTFSNVMGVTPYAWNPTPADGAECVNEYVWLIWTPGLGAVEHDVYFGTSFDDVNDATASEPPVDPYKGRQIDTFYEVSVLEPGTTYYWRIDEINDLDPGSPYKGEVWSFWLAPWEPTNPSPFDGETFVRTDADLSWTAGFQATQHEVFFGTDPCSLASIYLSAATTCDPGPLLTDTTYYWQVKEYQPGGRRTFGPIWSFSTTLPTTGTILYEYWDGITPTGTSLSLLYNWPDFPGNPTGTQILTLFEGPTNRAEQFGARIQAWLYAPVTGDYKFWIATDDNGELWLSSDEDPANKQLISWVSAWASPRNWTDPDVTPSGLIPLVAGQKYYIEALMKEGGGSDNIAVGWTTPFDDTIQVITGNYLERFVQMPAWNPSPADGAMEVPRPVTLRWLPGAYAAQHQVYFGTSEASMTLRDTLPIGTEEYDPPGTLDLGQTYYWKVNEVNVVGPDPCMWEGDVWSFTVFEYLLVDDMEDYNDRTSIITVWRDGYMGGGNVGNSGSNVTVSTASDDRDPRLFGDGPPWPVRDSEAMQFAYDNDGSITIYVPTYDPYTYSADANYYSEAKAGIANLPIGPNWTQGGVKALTLWFYGDAGNAIEPMWVKLTDQNDISGKVTYGDYGEDPNDLKDPSWHEWNIAMSDFGVDLTHVNDISIGFGDESNRTTPGGSGVVFFDDIRLYTPRCILSLRSPDFARADYIEDCVVDYKELELMAKNWLGALPEMIPITVPDAGFDDYVLAEGGYIDIADPLYAALDAWKCHSGDAWIDYGYWRADGYPEDLYALSGNNKAYGYEDYIYRILDETFIEGQTYTLSVWTGQPWGGDIRWSLYFTGEDYTNNLTEASGDSPLDWGQVKLVYTATASDAGNKIGIKMYGDSDVSFEDVTLFRSSAPLTDDPQVNLYDDDIINFKDYSLIASKFLEEEMFP